MIKKISHTCNGCKNSGTRDLKSMVNQYLNAMSSLQSILTQLSQTEHGFKHIVAAGDSLLLDKSLRHFDLAIQLLQHESYQGRMLGTHLLGNIAPENNTALKILKTKVAADDNWRVQEMLAKAFDQYAKIIGYEKALPVIKEWLSDSNPNVVRAVIEGLRIWTSCDYFKLNPLIAILLISEHKADPSEYVRKSVGNALRDISRKFSDLVKRETDSWDLTNKSIAFTYKLVSKS